VIQIVFMLLGAAVSFVVALPLGVLVTAAIVIWLVFNLWRDARRRRHLEALRYRQEQARLKAMEKSLRPPVSRRFWQRMRRD
jgi:hypothetical protein